jgi:serine/threonine protein kinase
MLSPGALLNERYQILHNLKRGGMGAVYAAQDTRLADSPCAVKELLDVPRRGDKAAIERRFREEMAVLSRLQHGGIPRVRDFFMVDEVSYLVMDLIEGHNLEEELEEHGRLSPAVVLEDAVSLLDILSYLHGQHPPVLHRDIKPANIIRQRGSKRLFLVDFGLAKHHVSNTTTAAPMATLGYAPLEQLQGHATQLTDIYSLGATMFHLLTGQVPELMDIPPIHELLPDLPEDVGALVMRAVQDNPAARWPSAASMREAALQCLEQLNAPAAGKSPTLVGHHEEAPDTSQLGSAAAPTTAQTAHSDSAGADRVLVIDDDTAIRTMLKRALEGVFYRVDVAENGMKGLEAAFAAPPDLILLDYDMPGMDGVTVCRKLRRHDATRDVPIIFLTGRADEEYEAQGLYAGADDYLVKPFKLERLLTRVEAMLQRARARRR